MVGGGGRHGVVDSGDGARRVSDAAVSSLCGAGGGAVRQAGRCGGCVVILAVYRLEHLSLGAAQPGTATTGSADPAAGPDRGDADGADGDRKALSEAAVRAGYAKLVGAAGDLCVSGGGGGDSTEDLERDPD